MFRSVPGNSFLTTYCTELLVATIERMAFDAILCSSPVVFHGTLHGSSSLFWCTLIQLKLFVMYGISFAVQTVGRHHWKIFFHVFRCFIDVSLLNSGVSDTLDVWCRHRRYL